MIETFPDAETNLSTHYSTKALDYTDQRGQVNNVTPY